MKKFAPYLIFMAAMLWATDAPFRVHLTNELSSSFIVLAEHFFDVLVVLPLLYLGRGELTKLSKKQWIAVIIIAVGGSALASVAFTQAFKYVNPSVAILLQKLQPLIAIALAASLLSEKISKYFWAYAMLALAGAYVISFPNLRPELFPGEQFNPNLIGIGLALLAAALWGASTVMGRYVLSMVDFKIMTSLRFVLAFVFLLIINLTQKTIPPLASVSSKDWLFLAVIAITSGVVSLFIYYRGLKDTKASIATLAELGFPMAAVLVNWVFLDAALLPAQIAGMALLLFAVYKLAEANVKDIGIEPVAVSSSVKSV
jgi:drug/metabolite transporter (DMT)-like permease